MNFGMPELLLIFGVITLFFGGKKIPELARGMGQAVREFRKSVKETNEVPQKPSLWIATPDPEEVKAIEVGGKGDLTNE